MKLIIAGSRNLYYPASVIDEIVTLRILDNVTELVSGGARGVDLAGENWNNLCNRLPVKQFLPRYDRYGKYLAPKVRDELMAHYADILLAIWDGVSGGTLDMITEMELLNKPVLIVIPKPQTITSSYDFWYFRSLEELERS